MYLNLAVGMGRNKPNEDPELSEPDRLGLFDRLVNTFGVEYIPDIRKYRKKLMILGIALVLFIMLYMLVQMS
jgi:hypothetical protein